MHLYVAGPMRGFELFNFPAFARASAFLRTLGHEVTSPAEMDLDMGLDPTIANTDAEHDFDVEDALRRDFEVILKADGIVLLEGWEKSSGARAERYVAETTGKAVYLLRPHGGSYMLRETTPADWSGDPRKPLGLALGLPEEPRMDSLQDLIDVVRGEGFLVEKLEDMGDPSWDVFPPRDVPALQTFDVEQQKALSNGRKESARIEAEAHRLGSLLEARKDAFPGESTREADVRRRKAGRCLSMATVGEVLDKHFPKEALADRLRKQGTVERIITEGLIGPEDTGIASDTTNPKDLLGVKKPQLHLVPESFVIRVAQAMTDGAAKYGPFNWREKAVRGTVYVSAARRHIAAWFDGEDNASDSGYPHLAHAAACLAILIDAEATGNLVDDRPTPGAAARLIEELTEK